jgi:dimethylamine/trimethylamine dehydrogenase
MGGATLRGPVLLFDDDHYYIGSVVAEKLRRDDLDVTLVTSGGKVSEWAYTTEEQRRAQTTLLGLGVHIETGTVVESLAGDKVTLACIYTGRRRDFEAASVVMVTSREPRDALYHALSERIEIARIGDCSAPGIIASAVHSGHRYARAMDSNCEDASLRERPTVPA